MDAILTFRNNTHDFIKPELSSVSSLKSAPGSKPNIMNGENYGVKKRVYRLSKGQFMNTFCR